MNKYKKDFPILNKDFNGKKLIYFDNAATSQKPKTVLDAVYEYNTNSNGNPHRSAHILSVKATEDYEKSKERVRKFINAEDVENIIYTKNGSESINLIARSFAEPRLKKGDKIVLTIAEHHSNIVPWQRVAKKTGAIVEYIYINKETGKLLEEDYKKIDENTKIVSFSHISNVLGMKLPVEELIKRAKEVGAITIVDGAQGVPHVKVDVQEIGCDFYTFSGHKMLSSLGIGVLYGKRDILKSMEPFILGGDMIEYVEEQTTTFAELPFKFEAGTQNVEGAVSLRAAIEYINKVGYDFIEENNRILMRYLLEEMIKIPEVNIIGSKDYKEKYGVIAFTIDGVHPHDVATIMDSYGIAIRSGHHCAQPLGKYLGIPASNRISPYFYNDIDEAKYFIEKLKTVRGVMGYGA
ncbi:SufS family cysteine desulfurase [Miniphocaeibacter halophilus]|uniref:SufS family cysteine desulfurase n=1 Tax=Miniphocaeibacter halophilus TaxID=2931922 RepID=A0AC61MPC1_9FIRM|nr:SufS family cysteine desulfurase [Miniphocaeibacter halophilus]QQK07247.1 SufS family cysteine desulfurase [Miniphocaeibacter halophilus]